VDNVLPIEYNKSRERAFFFPNLTKESKMLTLIPAYGRDYKLKMKVLEDFESDKDFIAMHHNPSVRPTPTNRSNLKRMGELKVRIRYAKLSKVIIVEVK